jgi:2'-5' RNA ligase
MILTPITLAEACFQPPSPNPLPDLLTGTYAALRPDGATISAIRQYVEKLADLGLSLGVEPVAEIDWHCTLLYSRVVHASYVPDKNLTHLAHFKEWKVFESKESKKKCLVMAVESKSILARHEYLMRTLGATYDFPDYIPHVTLSYNLGPDYQAKDPNDVFPPFNSPLVLADEYRMELD